METLRIKEVQAEIDSRTEESREIIYGKTKEAALMICEGVYPSDFGEGKKVRTLIRKALKEAKFLMLGVFMAEILEIIIDRDKEEYPQIERQRFNLRRVLVNEEITYIELMQNIRSIIFKKFKENMKDDVDKFASGNMTEEDKEQLLKRTKEKQPERRITAEYADLLFGEYGFPKQMVGEIALHTSFMVDDEVWDDEFKKEALKFRNKKA